MRFLLLIFVFVLGFRPLHTLATIFEGGGSETVSDTEAGVDLIENALQGSGVTGEGDFGQLLLKYIDFLLPYLALAAFLGYVYAGILYVTSGINPESIEKSKKILIYSTLGLILVILSYGIVKVFTVDLVKSIEKKPAIDININIPQSGRVPIDPRFPQSK